MIRKKSTGCAQKPASPKPDEAALAALARKYASAEFVPEWTAIERAFSVPELLENLPKRMKKRAMDEVLLDAIAHRKAQGRVYMDLRLRFGKSIRQMTDFVYRKRIELHRRIQELKSQSS
jgi:hypothetical protein